MKTNEDELLYLQNILTQFAIDMKLDEEIYIPIIDEIIYTELKYLDDDTKKII